MLKRKLNYTLNPFNIRDFVIVFVLVLKSPCSTYLGWILTLMPKLSFTSSMLKRFGHLLLIRLNG